METCGIIYIYISQFKSRQVEELSQKKGKYEYDDYVKLWTKLDKSRLKQINK